MKSLFIFATTLALSTTLSLAQGNVEAQSITDPEQDSGTSTVAQDQEMREVIKTSNTATSTESQAQSAKAAVRYDKKGGAVVPGASKGIPVKPMSKTETTESTNGSTTDTKSATATRTPAAQPQKVLQDGTIRQTPEKR